MRDEAIEMVCAHVGQGREPPTHHKPNPKDTYSYMKTSKKRNIPLYFTGSLLWNSCMWNQEFQDLVWTTTRKNMPISALGSTRYDLVLPFFFVFYFSGKVHVHLCMETHAGNEG